MSGKTIQIYLPDGNPRGMRIAEITTRIVRCFEIPRSELSSFVRRSESSQVGVYFLVGESEQGAPLAYIGQSGGVGERLKQHNQSKDFWTRALAVVSLTNNWTQTHVTYLEWLCLKAAKSADRFDLENANEGSKPFTPEAMEADCHEVFETIRFLTSTLGHPLFDELRQRQVGGEGKTSELVENASDSSKTVYFCTGKGGANGRGIYTADGFVVYKDSKARKELVPSLVAQASFNKARDLLTQAGKLQDSHDVLLFTEDVLFSSPSAASVMVMGRPSNGWIDWVTADGRTLDEVVRRSF